MAVSDPLSPVPNFADLSLSSYKAAHQLNHHQSVDLLRSPAIATTVGDLPPRLSSRCSPSSIAAAHQSNHHQKGIKLMLDDLWVFDRSEDGSDDGLQPWRCLIPTAALPSSTSFIFSLAFAQPPTI